MRNIVRITLDIRPAHNIDPGPLFERIKTLLETSDEFDIQAGSGRQLFFGEPHHDALDAVDPRRWPICAVCGSDSNFSLNGNVQPLCYEHHPSGRSSTPLPDITPEYEADARAAWAKSVAEAENA
jgi:hypothetical protein